MPNQFVLEEGCPVEVSSAKTQMEVDPFGTPCACRVYIDYRNIGEKPVNGVKFRLGYVDIDGKIGGLFHAPDGKLVSPGGQASGKWRGEKVSPTTKLVKIRVLLVRFSDGSLWKSQKLEALEAQENGASGTQVPDPADSAQVDSGSASQAESAL